ncbi:MAG: glycosyltransferase family 2 protein [Clostridiales bacterium]|nr:glycosyltransferase family 2 protein [Clostridiales bacterium]
MIVKNEEAVLKRCLDSLKPIVDEMIIVDTGSTDRTKEIAREYTDKVYDFAWVDDFSAARNASFEKAGCDYIYVADADEVLDEENQQEFLKLKQVLLPEIEIVQMLYCNQLECGTTYNFDEEYRPKLYKRIRTFCWEDPVHEAVRLQPVVYDSDIRIQHRPLTPHGSRDIDIFEKQAAKGHSLSKRLNNMYARELLMTGTKEQFQRAIPYFQKIAEGESASHSIDEVREAFCILCHAYRLMGKTVPFLKNALKTVADQPCSEVLCELGDYYLEEENDLEEAAMWYYNAAFESEPILTISSGRQYPVSQLVTICRRQGKTEEAQNYQKLLDC